MYMSATDTLIGHSSNVTCQKLVLKCLIVFLELYTAWTWRESFKYCLDLSETDYEFEKSNM